MFHDLIDLWNFEANKRGVTTGGIVTCKNIGFVLLTAVTRRRCTSSGVNESIQLIVVKYIIFKIFCPACRCHRKMFYILTSMKILNSSRCLRKVWTRGKIFCKAWILQNYAKSEICLTLLNTGSAIALQLIKELGSVCRHRPTCGHDQWQRVSLSHFAFFEIY